MVQETREVPERRLQPPDEWERARHHGLSGILILESSAQEPAKRV